MDEAMIVGEFSKHTVDLLETFTEVLRTTYARGEFVSP
jgi:hypothetical protein